MDPNAQPKLEKYIIDSLSTPLENFEVVSHKSWQKFENKRRKSYLNRFLVAGLFAVASLSVFVVAVVAKPFITPNVNPLLNTQPSNTAQSPNTNNLGEEVNNDTNEVFTQIDAAIAFVTSEIDQSSVISDFPVLEI